MFEPSADNFVVVDLDSGTIIGSNVRIIDVTDIPDWKLEELSCDQSAAWDYAMAHGIPIRLPFN